MNYRHITVFPNEDLGDGSGTEIINLDMVDPISRLIFDYKVTIGGDQSAHLTACIDKIELLDGSDVLLSLSGSELEALQFYGGGIQPQNWHKLTTSTQQSGHIVYDFGTKLFDQQLAFDPTKYTNPQLRVEWNADDVESSSSSFTLRIHAKVFDEITIDPVGFLQAKEIKSYSPSASAWEYTDLPLDYPYRLIALQYREPANPITDGIGQVKLSEDNDKRIPYDHDADELIESNGMQFGKIVDFARGTSDAGSYPFYHAPCYGFYMVMGADDTSNLATASSGEGGKSTINAAAGTPKQDVIVRGLACHGFVVLPVSDMKDLNSFWNVGGLGSLELQNKSGSGYSGSNPVNIVVQQLRRY